MNKPFFSLLLRVPGLRPPRLLTLISIWCSKLHPTSVKRVHNLGVIFHSLRLQTVKSLPHLKLLIYHQFCKFLFRENDKETRRLISPFHGLKSHLCWVTILQVFIDGCFILCRWVYTHPVYEFILLSNSISYCCLLNYWLGLVHETMKVIFNSLHLRFSMYEGMKTGREHPWIVEFKGTWVTSLDFLGTLWVRFQIHRG